MASEGKGGGFEVDFQVFGKNIGGSDREEDVITFFIILGGALGPNDCKNGLVSGFL